MASVIWPGRGEARRARAFVQQARDNRDWLAVHGEAARFAGFRRCRPLLTQLGAAQMRYYRYFRQRILAGQRVRGDVGYVHLFGQEAANGTLPEGVSRARALLGLLARAEGVDAGTRASVALWYLDAVVLDGLPGGVMQAAAITASAHHALHVTDLALQGLLDRIEAGVPLSRPTLDARAIIGGLPDLPFDAYAAPQPFTNQAALASLTAVDHFFRARAPAGKPMTEVFPSQGLALVSRHAFDEILYTGPTHTGGLLASAPAYHTSEALLQTLRHTLYMGQKLILEHLGVPGEHYHTDDRFTRTVAAAVASDLREFIRHASVPLELLRFQPGALLIDEAATGRGEPLASTAKEAEPASNPLTVPRLDTLTRLLTLDRPTYLTPQERYQQRLVVHRELASRQRAAAPKTLPPTTSDLTDWNSDQREWYVWWRTHWRVHHALLQPNAYPARAYAFELLNLIGFDTPESAYEELLRVVVALHQDTDQRYWEALSWPVTMAARYGALPDTPARAHFRSQRLWPFPGGFDPVCLRGWMQRRDFEELTLHTIASVLAFNPRQGVYLDNARHPDRYEAALRAAAQAADAHFQRVHGVSLFEHPNLLRFDDETAYPGASDFRFREFFGDKTKPARAVLAPALEDTLEFQAVAGALLKHVENRFRRADGVSGSRRLNPHPLLTPGLFADVDAAIQSWLGDPKPKVKLRFDPDAVEALEEQSAATRELLVSEEARAEADAERAPVSRPEQATRDEVAMRETVEVATLRGPDAELDEYVVFVTALNGLHRELLTLLLAGRARAALEAAARRHDDVLGAALEVINEQALEALGDTIMDMTDPPTIMEEHRQPLIAALKEAA